MVRVTAVLHEHTISTNLALSYISLDAAPRLSCAPVYLQVLARRANTSARQAEDSISAILVM